MSPGSPPALADLMRQAVFDLELRQVLFDEPERAIVELGLGGADGQLLMSTSRAAFDAAVGKLIVHRLLPTPLGQNLVVVPANGNKSRRDGRIPIILDQSHTGANIGSEGTSENSGRVFGTGTHPTTRLCVHMLEKYISPGATVLDLGTGSGVLALAAACLGARQVIGLDIDPNAVQQANANACRNGLEDKVQAYLGDASWPRSNGTGPFDLVVSNILVEVHCQSLEAGLISALRPGGVLLFSGMQRSGVEQLEPVLRRLGCPIIDLARIQPWYVLVARMIEGSLAD